MTGREHIEKVFKNLPNDDIVDIAERLNICIGELLTGSMPDDCLDYPNCKKCWKEGLKNEWKPKDTK